MLAGAAGASAQAPQWESSGPAKTQWAPFPTTAPPATKPVSTETALPPLALPAVDPNPSGGTRVVLFQKPAELPASLQPPELKQPEIKQPDPKKPDPKSTTPDSPKLQQGEPSREEVFRMTGDDELQGKPAVVLGDRKLTPPAAYKSRAGTSPPMRKLLEPGYVVHRRLYFEDKNSERYGWSFGMAQPLISFGYFAKNLLLWPSHLASNWGQRYDSNAGKYLPGTPVPYYLYPPEITLLGYSMGAAAIIGTIFLIP